MFQGLRKRLRCRMARQGETEKECMTLLGTRAGGGSRAHFLSPMHKASRKDNCPVAHPTQTKQSKFAELREKNGNAERTPTSSFIYRLASKNEFTISSSKFSLVPTVVQTPQVLRDNFTGARHDLWRLALDPGPRWYLPLISFGISACKLAIDCKFAHSHREITY